MLSRINYGYFFVFSFFIFCLSSFAQQDFEGKVVLRISGDETSDITYFIKGDDLRMEIESDGNNVIILHNANEPKSFILMPEQEMYMEIQSNDNESDSETGNNSNEVSKTGEFKDINGYNCEKWIFIEDGKTVEAWMTNELGGFFIMQNPMSGGTQDSWQQRLVGDYFPMLVVEMNESGETESTMEVLAVDQMSLETDLFVIPEGYQKFDMPTIPNMDMFK